MIGQERLTDIVNPIIKDSAADQTLVALWRNETGVTRFAESRIHQHLREEDLLIYVKVAKAGKLGVASTNSLDPGQLKRCLDQALAIAEHSRPTPYFDFFPHPEPPAAIRLHSPETAQYSPQARVTIVKQIIETAERSQLKVAGCFFTGEEELAVVNSVGRMAYQPMTATGLKIIMVKDGASGYANEVTRDVRRLHITELIERAQHKCLDSVNPHELEPGRYNVILEPEAVAELVLWLSYIGFGAKSLHERTGFMHNAIGQRLMSEALDLYDDGLDPAGLPLPFDFEGQPKQRVALIERGVAKGAVYDTHYAKITGTRTTGHAMLPDDSEGPQPLNLFIRAGTASPEQMIQRLDRGLLITRFHYVNGFLNPRKALMTGMTRDGTFYIEGGKIRYPVINLRFTQSVLEAFQRVTAVGQERRVIGDLLDGMGSVTCPALVLKDFTFTGLSK